MKPLDIIERDRKELKAQLTTVQMKQIDEISTLLKECDKRMAILRLEEESIKNQMKELDDEEEDYISEKYYLSIEANP